MDYIYFDLKWNFDLKVSYDVNDDDFDFCLDDFKLDNVYGIKCLGEVVVEVNNGVCGVGVVYNVKIGGIRMLDGLVIDEVEVKVLGFNCDYIDIFSVFWGLKDDGKIFGRFEEMGGKVMKRCVEIGR